MLYTAADARMLNYKVTVIKDGAASFSPEAHEFALKRNPRKHPGRKRVGSIDVKNRPGKRGLFFLCCFFSVQRGINIISCAIKLNSSLTPLINNDIIDNKHARDGGAFSIAIHNTDFRQDP